MTTSPTTLDRFVDQVADARLIPVLRSGSAREARAATARCFDAGITMVELTTSTPEWPKALEGARADHPGRLLGLGTVVTAGQAATAVDLGADFVVSPCPAPQVRAVLAGRVPFLEGGLSVGEVLDAAGRGIAKLFPAHVGGPQYLRSILAVAPGARIVPTGGIALRDVPEWLASGALAVGVGRDLLSAQDLAAQIKRVIEQTM
jgi:2-dehydro-3-deoxyphosphogluconate aldolase/(4S)-4-hydroxy-2-oxoglutarate aldolase